MNSTINYSTLKSTDLNFEISKTRNTLYPKSSVNPPINSNGLNLEFNLFYMVARGIITWLQSRTKRQVIVGIVVLFLLVFFALYWKKRNDKHKLETIKRIGERQVRNITKVTTEQPSQQENEEDTNTNKK